MSNFCVNGWNNYGEMDSMTVMATSKAEAERIAEECGLYGTAEEVRIHDQM